MREPRRSFVLLAVLVVIGGAILVATMLVQFAGAESAIASSSADRARSRGLALSAIEAILVELDGQRRQILEGRSIELEGQYVLYESDFEAGVVRLLPPGPGRDLLLPVGGLLDVNRATAAELVGTGIIEPAVADAIIASRSGRPDKRFRTLEDLLEVKMPDGTAAVSPELLMGSLDDFEPSKDILAIEEDRGERALEALDIRGDITLREVLTVYSFEPALQQDGVLRINLNVPYSEELGRRMDDRFGEGTGDGLRRIMERVEFDQDGRIVDVLRLFNAEPEDWTDVLDALTSDDHWHEGRIDLNTAPAEVLQSLEGIDPGIADSIVRERDSLSSEERATRVWPVLRELIEEDAFGALAGRITTRCWIWQVRLAAGTVSTEDLEGPIQSPVVLDLVVDLAAPIPRMAALRDISGLELGARLLGDRTGSFESREESGLADASDEESGSGSFLNDIDAFLDQPGFMDEFDSAFDDSSVFDEGFESAFDPGEEDLEGTEEDAARSNGPSGSGGSPGNRPRGRWSPR